MPGMVNMDHIGMYDALQSGTARNDATLAAALATIGATFKRLVLSFAGDGIWTFNSPWTIPTNVILDIPPGVYVAGSGNGTINGPFRADTPGWYAGTGTITLPQTSATYFNNLVTHSLGVNINPPLAQIHVSGDGSWPASVMVEERNGASGGATYNWKSVGAIRASMGIQTGSPDIILNMQGGVRFSIAGPGANQVGIGMTGQTHLLQLGLADAAMPGGGPFANSTSDVRLKKNVRPFTMGLAVALQLVAKYYEYNGLGETIDDGREYIGFIADDIVDVVPHMVGHDTSRKLYPTDETTTDFYTTNEGSLVHILLNAIKEQQALIVDLTARLEALEALTGQRADGLEAVAHTHAGSGNAGQAVPYTSPTR